MKYRSENLEKIKELTEEISTYENEEKKEISCALQQICVLLQKTRINKKAIIEQINSIITKLDF